jgi:hypothetical protein
MRSSLANFVAPRASHVQSYVPAGQGWKARLELLVLLYLESPKICLLVLAQGLASSFLFPEDEVLVKRKSLPLK